MENHRHEGPRPRSTLSSLLHLLVLLLPPALYLSGFVLTLVTISSPDYVRADQLTSPPPGSPVRITDTVLHASLWHTCTVVSSPLDGEGVSSSTETCVRRLPTYGSAGIAACEAQTNFNPLSRICQKVVTAAELYLAAAILGGIAMAAAIFCSITEVALWEPRGDTEYAGAVSRFRRTARRVLYRKGEGEGARVFVRAWGLSISALALAAAGCLVLGQVLGVDALVVEGSAAFTNDFVPDGQTRWYLSTGALRLTSAAYVTMFSGAFVALTRCGLGTV